LKLLIDNQLPEALAEFLTSSGFECRHVRRVGLGTSPDAVIWDFAKGNGFAIVTMDEDFQHLAARYGTPPQVIWVRLGNVRKLALIEAFKAILPDLRTGLDNGTAVIEIG
jgi:predicted nuclease of predicted toxin-antitoxin system